jgi:predicted nucleic acid-binding protein
MVSTKRRGATAAASHHSVFVDTTVLVAAAVRAHPHHDRSSAVLSALGPRTGFCAAHSLAELYATLTALPIVPRIHPADAAAAVRHRAQSLHTVALSAEEQLQAVLTAAARSATTGQVYDALIHAAAAKSDADIIYTWNLRHFERFAEASTARKLRLP